MKPFIKDRRVRRVRIWRNIIESLTPKELMRLYSELGVVIDTEYLAVNDMVRLFVGNPKFEALPRNTMIPDYDVTVRVVKRRHRPYKLFKMVKRT